MQTTGNLGLKKPEGTDVVNIDDLNYNADILDVEVTKLATTSQAGRMSAADKAKLDGIAASAEVNQNAFTNVKVGTTTISADSKTDTLELEAGSGISLTPDATNDKVTIGVDAASSATASKVVQRDSAGRAQFASPAANADAATKGYVDTRMTTHIADYIRHPGYAAATGSANDYLVTLDPAPAVYLEGMALALKINVTNTGASTINVNGLGAKPIKKANGNDVAAGNLKAGGIYTFRYDGSVFILQGEGGSGDAQPGDVIFGKTFTNDNGEQTGTLILTGTAGLGDVLAGKTFYNLDPKSKQTGTMPNRAGDTVALSSVIVGTMLKLLASAGYRDGIDDYVTITDPNFISSNIRNGVSIFGLPGSLVEGKKYATGGVNSDSNNAIEVHGLNFRPRLVYFVSSNNKTYGFAGFNRGVTMYEGTLITTPGFSLYSDGFRISNVYLTNWDFTYYAFE